jgi:hypothetical protein
MYNIILSVFILSKNSNDLGCLRALFTLTPYTVTLGMYNSILNLYILSQALQ